jgi:hypothetical protein
MFSRKTFLFVALTACVLVTPGALIKPSDANGHAPGQRPPRLDPYYRYLAPARADSSLNRRPNGYIPDARGCFPGLCQLDPYY